jgi:hypothetical protein
VSIHNAPATRVIALLPPQWGIDRVAAFIEAMAIMMFADDLNDHVGLFKSKPRPPLFQAKQEAGRNVFLMFASGQAIFARYSNVLAIEAGEPHQRVRFQPEAYRRVTIDPVTYAPRLGPEIVTEVLEYERADMSFTALSPPLDRC